MTTTYERERQLQQEIAPRIEHDLPGVDVLGDRAPVVTNANCESALLSLPYLFATRPQKKN